MLGFLGTGIVLSLWLTPPPAPAVSLPFPSPAQIANRQPTTIQRHGHLAPAKLDACQSLYSLACGGRAILEDPTGVVQPDVAGEVEALRIYETIIHRHPEWTSDQVDEALVKEIYTESRRKRMNETFHWVKQNMLLFVEQQSWRIFSRAQKRELKKRIRETQLELPPPASIYSNEPDLFTKNTVYYGRFPDGRRVVRIGGAYVLTAKSLFNRVFTFAHEMAHSIDPCDLGLDNLQISAYAPLTACFRDAGLLNADKIGQQCSESLLPEIFADWIATQVTAIALQQYRPNFEEKRQIMNSIVNSVRDLCLQEPWLEVDLRAHPEPQLRIDRIFGAHAEIRELMGCSQPPAYAFCSFSYLPASQ